MPKVLTYGHHMKLGPAVIGIIITGALGYLLEPSLRPALLPTPDSMAESKSEGGGDSDPSTPVEGTRQTPKVAPVVEAAPDWVATLKPEQLPDKVKLKERAVLPIPGSNEPMTLPAGVEVTPKRVKGNNLVITPFGGPIEGTVPAMSTDLVERLGNKAPSLVAAAAVEPVPPVMPDPVEPAVPVTPEPVAPAASKQLSPEEIVTVMQESVKAGEIKEFTFDQVLGWKASEEKESGGETYQSGQATYKAETIFGVKNIQAQALIKSGKVEKWIWPKSGMEIK